MLREAILTMGRLDEFIDNLQHQIFEEAKEALGRDPDELADVTAETVLNTIGRLPEKDLHCATLAARTVQEALTHYMSGLVTKAEE